MLAWLERNQFLLLSAAGLLLLLALSVRAFRDEPAPVIVFHEAGALEGGPITVHVAGGVRNPGVYQLEAGARVEAAVAAAGGALDAGNLDEINLARTLNDGERVLVPGAQAQATAPPATSGPVNINTASQRELEALPGVGEAYSRRIIDSRVADGPYQSVDELVQRRVLPAATLERIRGLLTAIPQ